MVVSGTESEIKLEAGIGFVVPDLSGIDGGSAVGLPERRMSATYVDTTDLRLLRAGISLRHRHEVEANRAPLEEWTLKLPMAADGGAVVRRELRWEAPMGPVPTELGRLVRAWSRGAPLGTVARLVTVRQRTAVRDAEGEDVAEVDDDVVSVMDGPRLAARFREVEVELGPAGRRRQIKAIVGRLEDAGARRGDGLSKVVRAIGSPALAPPDVVPLRVGGRATLAEVVRAVITDAYLRVVRHDPGLRLDDDPEDVHQARVATRRLRSDLRFLRHSLDIEWVTAARDELAWLGGVLGAVRDADVLLERLRASGAALPERDEVPLGKLLGTLAAERDRRKAELAVALDSPRYTRLLDRLVAATVTPPMARTDEDDELLLGAGAPLVAATLPPADDLDLNVPATTVTPLPRPAPGASAGGGLAGGEPAREVLPRLVRRPWRHLRNRVRALGEDPTDEELHRVRIEAKRLRYACETAAPVCGRPARDLARAAADLQTVLGDLHDAAVASDWLRAAAAGAPGDVAVVAGELVARQGVDAAAARALWPKAWKRLNRGKLRAWFD